MIDEDDMEKKITSENLCTPELNQQDVSLPIHDEKVFEVGEKFEFGEAEDNLHYVLSKLDAIDQKLLNIEDLLMNLVENQI